MCDLILAPRRLSGGIREGRGRSHLPDDHAINLGRPSHDLGSLRSALIMEGTLPPLGSAGEGGKGGEGAQSFISMVREAVARARVGELAIRAGWVLEGFGGQSGMGSTCR